MSVLSAAGTARVTLSRATRAMLLLRILVAQVARTRWGRAAWAGGRAAAASVARAGHLLWLEITGVLFAAIALMGAGAFVREYQAWTAGKIGPGRAALALVFTAAFAWFAVSSFWRVRQRSRGL